MEKSEELLVAKNIQLIHRAGEGDVEEVVIDMGAFFVGVELFEPVFLS